MNLVFADDGTVTGTVYFGAAAPLPPATDPNVGYPPGFGASLGGPGLPRVSLEGFDFTVLAGSYAAPRVQLSISQTEIWKRWCEIQTVIYPVDNGNAPDGGCGDFLRYGCLPNATTMFGSSCAISWCQNPASIPVDCGKMALCGPPGVCTCTATGCTVPPSTKGDVAFDMQAASGAMNGSVTGLDGQLHNVHLTRSP
jgi:hypothetical protein